MDDFMTLSPLIDDVPAAAPSVAALGMPAATPMKPDLLLVDINGMGYAAMYTPMGRLSHNGFPTGGIHGAMTSLLARMTHHPGAAPFVLWDRRATWRHEALPEYKANRAATPEKQEIRATYRMQTPIIQLLLNALGIPQISCGEAEADDLAGFICRGIDPSWMIEMDSRDTDWYQGIADNINWYSPLTKRHVTLSVLADPDNGLTDGHFLSTWEYLQAKALAGDTSDDIPGLDKIGLKTACKVMREHGATIQDFWRKVDDGSFVPKGVILQRLASTEARAVYERNIRLMDWRQGPPLRTNELALTAGTPDWAQAKEIAAEYGLAKVLSFARTVLKPWEQSGWGRGLDAVHASLYPEHCLPVPKLDPIYCRPRESN